MTSFEEQLKYPIRINKYLAIKGYSTRRDADLLIKKGKVFINEQKAQLGDKVNKGDVVTVANDKIKKTETYFYFVYNKPKGEETGKWLNKNIPMGVFPVGRLDKLSEGLLILTNDGRLTDRLLNPERSHDKEYEVEVDKPLSGFFMKQMEAGVKIEGYKTRRSVVKKIDRQKFSIVLTEGKRHQIRRMCAALGYQVKNLKRFRILNIKLGNLKAGDYRNIESSELKNLLISLGLLSS